MGDAFGINTRIDLKSRNEFDSLHEALQSYHGLTPLQVGVKIVRDTADTEKQEAVAHRLINASFPSLSIYDRIQCLQMVVALKYATVQLSLEEATCCIGRLDSLFKVLCKSKGYVGHPGGIPNERHSSTFSGHFCTHMDNPDELSNTTAFQIFTLDNFEDQLFEFGIKASAEQLQDITDEVFPIDMKPFLHENITTIQCVESIKSYTV